ncbi:MAG: hypothetical protein MUE42_06320 [Opitutaceae bacterium]|nr:hypothetical protein [Opitutaceae bacterium]
MQASDDLLNWETITVLHAPTSTWFGAGALADTLDGDWREAVVIDPGEPTRTRRFLRVRVEPTW